MWSRRYAKLLAQLLQNHVALENVKLTLSFAFSFAFSDNLEKAVAVSGILSRVPNLDGPNRQSPIAGVQRTRSTQFHVERTLNE